jgi:hypothetical protein
MKKGAKVIVAIITIFFSVAAVAATTDTAIINKIKVWKTLKVDKREIVLTRVSGFDLGYTKYDIISHHDVLQRAVGTEVVIDDKKYVVDTCTYVVAGELYIHYEYEGNIRSEMNLLTVVINEKEMYVLKVVKDKRWLEHHDENDELPYMRMGNVKWIPEAEFIFTLRKVR